MPDASPTLSGTTSETLDRLLARHPEHAPLIAAFRALSVAQAELAETADPAGALPVPPVQVEPDLFAQGRALLPADELPDGPALDDAFLAHALALLAPAIAAGLPAVADDVRELARLALTKGGTSGGKQDTTEDASQPPLPRQLATWALTGRISAAQTWARRAGLSPDAVGFVAMQLAAASARRVQRALAPSLAPHAEGWTHGHCPVCGTAPKLGVLRGEGGQRWLVCALCDHTWRHQRTACPFCGVDKPDNITLRYVQGFEDERAEACGSCRRYILAADLRHRTSDVPSVLPLGMAHLDMLLQEKGFMPGGVDDTTRTAQPGGSGKTRNVKTSA
ncbi:formate dehydrogenase accessory protein FdhE [Desulfovibrio oxamicus]|uniref:Formate dehydrogenase accessory protein FdhE n=1 Tax=Nitratidesulfovibrio oxamicus TaxID=32016 RepID=A0ABS0J531_9BACT|nr:formate dehydrogenase accessory protein FdhE [Nitratidesulfovibrio oxamicus]MBG3877272.1 formate dehydrogenase accessory protein FdhE [Nitratidesulfovibrio oxamicus]